MRINHALLNECMPCKSQDPNHMVHGIHLALMHNESHSACVCRASTRASAGCAGLAAVRPVPLAFAFQQKRRESHSPFTAACPEACRHAWGESTRTRCTKQQRRRSHTRTPSRSQPDLNTGGCRHVLNPSWTPPTRRGKFDGAHTVHGCVPRSHSPFLRPSPYIL